MTILVTGVAGFIGYHVARRLISEGHQVVGLDNLNDYYDVTLKQARLAQLSQLPQAGALFHFYKQDLADQRGMQQVFDNHRIERVVHLAAQAGVRYSMENPQAYVQSNLVGFLNILEGCRAAEVAHLVYASSSSVYGLNTALPFSEQQAADHPISFYGASKRANELMAHSYSSLYNLPTTGLRFFTVYGPWGRPDMALFKFTKAILAGEHIDVFNHGHHKRDFTYVDDVVEGICRVLQQPTTGQADFTTGAPNAHNSQVPWRVFNIGNHKPVELLHYIRLIESYLGKKAQMNLLPLQPGDVSDTYADVSLLQQAVAYQPSTTVETGIQRFLDWYLDFYAIKHPKGQPMATMG